MTTSMAYVDADQERWDLREIGLWMFLGTVAMLFAAFTSALIVRKASEDWVPIRLPLVMWVNTGVLLLSSGTLERARRLIGERRPTAMWWVVATCTLGLLFVVGQAYAWRALAQLGYFLPTTPAASFLYVLTGIHAAHVLAGLVCLAWLLAATARPVDPRTRFRLAGIVTTFWHFLAAVWLYLAVLLAAA